MDEEGLMRSCLGGGVDAMVGCTPPLIGHMSALKYLGKQVHQMDIPNALWHVCRRRSGRGSAIIMRRLFKEISRNNNVGWQPRKTYLGLADN